MTAIRIIGFLFASLALCGIAEAQKGGGKPGGGGGDTLANLNCSTDQIARFNGTAWVCSEDRAGIAATYKVFDGNGVELPFPFYNLGQGYGEMHAMIDIEGQSEPYILYVDKEHISPRSYRGFYLFESCDCSQSNFYFLPSNLDWLDKRFFIPIPLNAEQTQYEILYSSAPPSSVTKNICSIGGAIGDQSSCGCFELNEAGGCAPVQQEVVEIVGSVKFNIPFVPPFRLALK